MKSSSLTWVGHQIMSDNIIICQSSHYRNRWSQTIMSLDMYADDSTLGASRKTVEDLGANLNPNMAKVNKWCKDNKMAINCDKTKAMLITIYEKEAKLDSTHLSVIYDNTKLENVNSLTKISPRNFILIRQPNLSATILPF